MAAKCRSSLFLLWLKQNRQPIYTTQQAQHSSLAIGLVGVSELSWAFGWDELKWTALSQGEVELFEHTCLLCRCLRCVCMFCCPIPKIPPETRIFNVDFVLAFSFAACILYVHHQRQSINHHHSPYINVHGYPTNPTIRYVAFLFVCCFCRFTYR